MMAFLRALWAVRSKVLALAIVALLFGQKVLIDRLQGWQDRVVEATRDAADHPKLATRAVPQQIRNLGLGMNRIHTAMVQAKADALAAKIKAETADENRRKDADDGLAPILERALASTDVYGRDQRLRCRIEGTPAHRGDDVRADLPGAATPATVPDRSGAEPAMVLVARSALNTCTTLKVRLDNAHDWAMGGER